MSSFRYSFSHHASPYIFLFVDLLSEKKHMFLTYFMQCSLLYLAANLMKAYWMIIFKKLKTVLGRGVAFFLSFHLFIVTTSFGLFLNLF